MNEEHQTQEPSLRWTIGMGRRLANNNATINRLLANDMLQPSATPLLVGQETPHCILLARAQECYAHSEAYTAVSACTNCPIYVHITNLPSVAAFDSAASAAAYLRRIAPMARAARGA